MGGEPVLPPPVDGGERSLEQRSELCPGTEEDSCMEIVAAVEGGLKRSNSWLIQQARTRIVGLLARSRPLPNLLPEEQKAIKYLKADSTISIAQAGKENATIVMNRTDYNEKVRSLPSDTDTYKKLSRDPTAAQERKLNSLLLALNRSGSIPDQLYHRLCSTAGQIPRLYGLPKVHKSGIPRRPIASFINSLKYALSQHLVSILSPLVGKSSSHVKNSADFSTFIAGLISPLR